jgi:hypothetical protein
MPLEAKDSGHPFAETENISLAFYTQTNSPAPFGYDYYLSLPPSYDSIEHETFPLILFLHGAGESQRGEKESYGTLRHGVPKIILCYDKWKSSGSSEPPVINIPLAKATDHAGALTTFLPVTSYLCSSSIMLGESENS